MLQSLRIKNLAIAEDIQVRFEAGLNVITGETGAGKSILAAALGLVLGARADRTAIRAGAPECTVEAAFALPDTTGVDSVLAALGLDPCEDGQVIVRRIMSTSGAGRNLLNDAPVTLQALRQIGDLLVDQHGPHDHQSLLDEQYQLEILDAFGHHADAVAAYAGAYARLQELDTQRRELDGDDSGVADQIEMLTFQITEIEQAALVPGEEETVPQEHTQAAHAGRILELGGTLTELLSEDNASVFNLMAQVQHMLAELRRILPEAEAWRDEAAAISVQAQELAAAIRTAVQDIDCEAERFQWLEDRMALLQRFKRKYGPTVEAILTFRDQAVAKREALSSRGERLKAAEAALAAQRQALVKVGRQLTAKRSAAAVRLAQSITAELRDLGFAHGAFEVTVSAAEAPRPSGLDVIDFGFAPNTGEPMRPLKSIASSGEISRVMLAVKAVLAEHDRIPVLVFDEIDANVGGETGTAIGVKLTTVAAGHQVLCITHLPQVAVQGKTHFVVAKQVKDGRTVTGIAPVTGDTRVEEIARMLGGRKLTSVTLQHAREMLGG